MTMPLMLEDWTRVAIAPWYTVLFNTVGAFCRGSPAPGCVVVVVQCPLVLICSVLASFLCVCMYVSHGCVPTCGCGSGCGGQALVSDVFLSHSSFFEAGSC